jgi:hypothetical protein
MKAQDFFVSFKKKIEVERKDDAVKNYVSNKNFTEFVIPAIREILSDNIKYTQKEYFRIDSICWSECHAKIEVKKPNSFNLHLWNLDVAVEHENDSNDWMDEVTKLAHICCPLRVVIGYVPYKQKDNHNEYLNYVVAGIKKLNCYENFKANEFLIILGNSNTNGDENKYFGYKGYLFNPTTEKFEELNYDICNF